MGKILDSVSAGLYAPTESIGGSLVAAASPELANQIGQYFKGQMVDGKLSIGDNIAHKLAHGILGAAVAAATGQDVTNGALAGAGAEILGEAVTNWLYPNRKPSDLTAEEKNLVSSIVGLGTAGIGLATGNGTTDVATGSMIGQNAVENNNLAQAAKPIITMIIGALGIEVARESSDDLVLSLEQLLKNTDSNLQDYVKNGELQLTELASDHPEAMDIVRDTLNLSQDQLWSITMKPVGKDYFAQNDFGKILANSGLEVLGYDLHGNIIVSPSKMGAGDYIDRNDIVQIDVKTGSISVANKDGYVISVLNPDGTRNTELSNQAKGTKISSYKPITMDMVDRGDIPDLKGFPISEKDGKPLIYVPPETNIPNHTGHGDSGKVEVDPIAGGGYQPVAPPKKEDVYVTNDIKRDPTIDFHGRKGPQQTLEKHAKDHGYGTDTTEYLRDARKFLDSEPNATTETFTSEQGWTFRYDHATNEFGIINNKGGISTYYKPDKGLDYWNGEKAKYKPKD